MKRLLIGMLGVFLFSSAIVVNAHQGSMNEQSQSVGDRSQMMQIREHMGKAETLMGEIKSNKQPEKRQELMHEHMQQMRMGMDMMHKPGGMMGGGKLEARPHMGNRMSMMEDNMQMMQKMMKQMMEHQSQLDMPMHR